MGADESSSSALVESPHFFLVRNSQYRKHDFFVKQGTSDLPRFRIRSQASSVWLLPPVLPSAPASAGRSGPGQGKTVRNSVEQATKRPHPSIGPKQEAVSWQWKYWVLLTKTSQCVNLNFPLSVRKTTGTGILGSSRPTCRQHLSNLCRFLISMATG